MTYYQRHKKRILAQQAEYRRKNRRRVRRAVMQCHYKTRYGIDIQQVEEMRRKQKNCCAVCGRRKGKRHLHLDHCHQTGKIRGLLCHNCNRGLGYFGDQPALLVKAAHYLRRFR